MVDEDANIFDTRAPIINHLTYREWHAFVNGFYIAVARPGKTEYEGREKHYWRGGWLCGWVIKIGAIVGGYEHLVP